MLKRVIELHDSTIGAIAEVHGGQVVVFFTRAYIYLSEREPGWDPSTIWIQAAALSWAEAVVRGNLPELPEDIYDGTLAISEKALRYIIPVPFKHAGPVTLKVQMGSGDEIVIEGRDAELTLLGSMVYLEDSPR